VQVHKCNQFSLARNETYNAAYVRHIEASRSVSLMMRRVPGQQYYPVVTSALHRAGL
jgi:hypothetical protein